MRDEPDADAMPAARPRRQVRLFMMAFAVRRFYNRISTEAEITLGVAERPVAGFRVKCDDRSGSRA